MQKTRWVTVVKKVAISFSFILGLHLGCLVSKAENTVFFSPGDNISKIITLEIAKANKSIDVAIFGFTDLDIAYALIKKHQQGVKVRVYRDKLQSKESGQKALNKLLVDAGIPLRVKETGILMHMKCMIVDGKTLLTGSYNWSAGAKKQDNDFIICDAPCSILPVYKEKFKEMGFEY